MEQHHGAVVGAGNELGKSRLCGGLLVVVPIHIGKAPENRFITQFLSHFQIFLTVDPLGRPVVFGQLLAGFFPEQILQLRQFLGKGAEAMIALEKKEGKYRKDTHPARFNIIAENWDRILQIMDEELPSSEEIEKLLDTIGISKDLSAIGVDTECARTTFKATKDIRDKYVLSRLCWDLGLLEESFFQ